MSGGSMTEDDPQQMVQRGAQKPTVFGFFFFFWRQDKGDMKANNLPTSKCFPTSIPLTSKGLLLGMGSLVPLHVLHTPNMKKQYVS